MEKETQVATTGKGGAAFTFEDIANAFLNDGVPKLIFTAIADDTLYLRIFRAESSAIADDGTGTTQFVAGECIIDTELEMSAMRAAFKANALMQRFAHFKVW